MKDMKRLLKHLMLQNKKQDILIQIVYQTKRESYLLTLIMYLEKIVDMLMFQKETQYLQDRGQE